VASFNRNGWSIWTGTGGQVQPEYSLGRGQTLVQEYLELIQTYLKDSETMRGYLRQKGVQLPAQISYGG